MALSPSSWCAAAADREMMTIGTWRVGSEVNAAFGMIGASLVLAFKRKMVRGVSPGCRATYALDVTFRNETVSLAPAFPKRRCKNVRSWRSSGPEDARLTPLRNGLAMLVNDFAPKSSGEGYRRTQYFAYIDDRFSLSTPRVVDREGGDQEKKWSPWVYQDRLMAHQWLHPQSVALEITTEEKQSTATFYRHTCKSSLGRIVRAEKIAGGTNAIRLNSTHFLAIGHTYHEASAYRIYAMFGYLFEASPPFCVTAATPEFHLRPPSSLDDCELADMLDPRPARPDYSHIPGIEVPGNKAIQFPMSLADNHDNNSLVLSWGRADRDSFFSSIRRDWFLSHFHLLDPRDDVNS